MPCVEGVRKRGSNEKIIPSSEIVKIVYLDVTLASVAELQFSLIRSISAEDLVTALGSVNSLADRLSCWMLNRNRRGACRIEPTVLDVGVRQRNRSEEWVALERARFDKPRHPEKTGKSVELP